jgi:tetratricopeptide (TPR) repeat protein
MRIRAGILVALLTLSGAPLAGAEETAPSIGGDVPDAGTVEKPKAEKLDELFATLKSAKSDAAAKTAEGEILRLWLDSGSDTVDILMVWAIRAMGAKEYSTALDLLDRIVTMKPDYIEGWNKRATVYFLTDDYAKSIADIGRTLALDPRHFGALAGLGMIMHGLGDDKRAIEAYKGALAVDPYLDNIKKALDALQAGDTGSPI